MARARESREGVERMKAAAACCLFTLASMRRVKESTTCGVHAAWSATEVGLTMAIRHDDIN
jgi:hypothetical protein